MYNCLLFTEHKKFLCLSVTFEDFVSRVFQTIYCSAQSVKIHDTQTDSHMNYEKKNGDQPGIMIFYTFVTLKHPTSSPELPCHERTLKMNQYSGNFNLSIYCVW